MIGQSNTTTYHYQPSYRGHGIHSYANMISPQIGRQLPFPQHPWNGYPNVPPFPFTQPNNFLNEMTGMVNPFQPFGIFNNPPFLDNSQIPYQGSAKNKNNSEAIFQNPLQQKDDSVSGINPNLFQPFPTMNPYPKTFGTPRPPSGVQSIMNSFKTQDGNLDINKMIDTAGQMMNAVTQVSSMVKGLGGIFKV